MDFDLAFGICLTMLSLYFGYSGKPIRYVLIPFFLSAIKGLIFGAETFNAIPAPLFAGLWFVSLGIVLLWDCVLWWIGRWIGRRKED